MRIIFLLFLLIFVSCGETGTTEDDDIFETTGNLFFNIVYHTYGTRLISSSNLFEAHQGVRELKFNTTTDTSDPDEVPENLEGDFTVIYNNFVDPISGKGPCQGGYKGKFEVMIVDTSSDLTEIIDEDDPVYDIFEPYIPFEDIDPVDSDSPAVIVNYKFNLTVEEVSFYPPEACPSVMDEHSLDISRFMNGELIISDSSSGRQYYMKPNIRE